MNRQSMYGATLILAAAFAVTPARLSAQQPSQDRKSIQADGAKSAADEKEVKRLNDLSAKAISHTRELHQVYLQKLGARETAVKSYGGKDSRAQQAYKEEATAKQEWSDGIKNERDIEAQRKAAIDKAHADSLNRNKDVNKLDSDETKKGTSSAPKQ